MSKAIDRDDLIDNIHDEIFYKVLSFYSLRQLEITPLEKSLILSAAVDIVDILESKGVKLK